MLNELSLNVVEEIFQAVNVLYIKKATLSFKEHSLVDSFILVLSWDQDTDYMYEFLTENFKDKEEVYMDTIHALMFFHRQFTTNGFTIVYFTEVSIK